jgi:hypothetical protein
MKKRIALTCSSPCEKIDDWHHYGFWYKTLMEHEKIETEYFLNWREMPEGFDLYFFIDHRPDLWALSDYDKYKPRALFWWDSFHHMFSVSVQLALLFDKVYVAELLDAQHAQLAGFQNTKWLPGAFYPGLYKPLSINKEYNVGFVGQLDDTVKRKGLTRRTAIVELLKTFGGQVRWDIRGPEVNEIYNKSRVLFERTIFCNIGTRLFETVGSGGLALVNRPQCYNGLDQIGIDGIHFVSYDESLEDMLQKANRYVYDQNEREKIVKAGHEHFLANHTYRNRIDTILRDFNII